VKTHSRSMVPWIAFLLLAAALVAGPVLAQNCVQFQGIDHCPVGDATLQASSAGLTVQNNGGTAGVSSRFLPTVHWNGQMEFAPGGANKTALSSISNGETTSRLLIEPAGQGYRVRATFTGSSDQPTYSVLVYNKGILAGALGPFDGSEPTKAAGRGDATKPATVVDRPEEKVAVYVDGIYWGNYDFWWWDFVFFIAPTGGCNWGLNLEQAVSVRMPNGQTVVGDEIRFSEDIHGSGHYPYLGFESIETVSTAQSFAITGELAEGNR
jgi:hypothetical protein